MEERILFFCNNIASSLIPLYDVDEELAFTKAYDEIIKESFWQNFQRMYLKKILIALPLCIVVGVFVYAVFDLEVNNIRIQNNVNGIINNHSD